MLTFGTIQDIENYKAKIKILETGMTTEWLYVPQLFTKNSKSGYTPEVGTLVAAILTDDMENGVILGAIYNDEDVIVEEFQGKDFIKFKEGAYIAHSKETNELEFMADKLKIISDVECLGDISDKKGSMQAMRDIYNNHTNPNGGIVAEKMQ